MKTYTALLFRDPTDPEVWLGAVPAVRGVHSFGDTREHALEMTAEALEGMLELLFEIGERIPNDETDLEPAKVEWRELLGQSDVQFETAKITVRAEVMHVAA